MSDSRPPNSGGSGPHSTPAVDIPAGAVVPASNSPQSEPLANPPNSKEAGISRQITVEHQMSYRSGMLPEPAELAAYNQIIPNGAERIFKMVENQSTHRIELEKTVVNSQQRLEARGQSFGLIIALFFCGCGLYAAINGQPWFGGVVVSSTLVSIVGIFVFSRQSAKQNLANKRNSNMSAVPSGQQPQPADAKNKAKTGKQR